MSNTHECSDMFDEIISKAIKISKKYGVIVKGDKAAEYLISTVGSYAASKRRESEFFDVMSRVEDGC